MPPPASAATGIDAMVHAIEAYTSGHKKNPLSDVLAHLALKLPQRNFTDACRNGRNLAARQPVLSCRANARAIYAAW